MEDRHELTAIERQLIIRAHTFFSIMKKQGRFKGQRARELVAQCLGYGEMTVVRTLDQYYEDPESLNEVISGFRAHADAVPIE